MSANIRIRWIDIAKGIMIIGMVVNHIPNYCGRAGVSLDAFPWFLTFGNAYGVFTMQSFFILSGYTTNFNIDFNSFLLKQVKGLIIPYISFSVICGVISYYAWGNPFYVNCFGERWFFLMESYWFLTALFVAKLLCFLLNNLFRNKTLELGGGILLLIIGIAISEFYQGAPEPTHWHNWFHYRNGLCMTVFLPIGYLLKERKVAERYGLQIGVLYCILYCLTYLMLLLDIPSAQYFAAPSYTHYLFPNLKEVNGFLLIPSYLFYTIAGSILVFWLSQKIGGSRMLEFFGRKSLLIYCLHVVVLKFFISICYQYFDTSMFIGAGLLFTVVAFFTLIACVVLAWLFDKRPLKYLAGKF